MGVCQSAAINHKKLEVKSNNNNSNTNNNNKSKSAIPNIPNVPKITNVPNVSNVPNKPNKINNTDKSQVKTSNKKPVIVNNIPETRKVKIQKLNSKTEDAQLIKEIDTVCITLVVEYDQHYFIINDPLFIDKIEISEKKNNYEFHKFIEDYNKNAIEEQINNFIHDKCNFFVERKGDLNYLIGKLKECPPGSDDNFRYYISTQ